MSTLPDRFVFSDSPDGSAARSFATLARSRLRQQPTPHPMAGSPSDYDLNPSAALPSDATLKPAAVLIPVVARAELTVLLTLRTADLARHAGQIAFPGGRIDPSDASAQAAALREAHEEVGLDAAHIMPLGFLDSYRTGTGYRIEPLVALIAPDHILVPEPREVADAFEVPLAFLMDPRNHETQSRIWQGAERRFYAMTYENRYIWGATAGILRHMHERLFAP